MPVDHSIASTSEETPWRKRGAALDVWNGTCTAGGGGRAHAGTEAGKWGGGLFEIQYLDELEGVAQDPIGGVIWDTFP